LRFKVNFKIVWNVDDLHFNNIFWFSNLNNQFERSTLLLDDIFSYQIWCTKVRKIIDIDLITCNTVHILNNIFRIKPSVRQAFQNNNSLTNGLQVMG
jgi:hypothetical protein